MKRIFYKTQLLLVLFLVVSIGCQEDDNNEIVPLNTDYNKPITNIVIPDPDEPLVVEFSSKNVFLEYVAVIEGAAMALALRDLMKEIGAAGAPYYELAENNPAYYNSTNTDALESSLRTVLNRYTSYSNSNLSNAQISAIRKTAERTKDNLSKLVDLAKEEILIQEGGIATRLWKPKKLFGKIVQAVVNLVLVVPVTTTLGIIGVSVQSAPNNISNTQKLVGPLGGFIAGITWWAAMLADNELYWI